MQKQAEYIYKLVKSYGKKFGYISEEIIQDLVGEVWKAIDSYNPKKASFSTFVYTVIRNQYSMIIRKSKPLSLDSIMVKDDEGEEINFIDTVIDRGDSPLESIIKLEKARLISYIYEYECSDILKEYLQGHKQKDIAIKYGIPYSTCNQQIQRELKRLKETYGE